MLVGVQTRLSRLFQHSTLHRALSRMILRFWYKWIRNTSLADSNQSNPPEFEVFSWYWVLRARSLEHSLLAPPTL